MIKFSGLSTAMEDFLIDQSFTVDTGINGRVQLVGIRGCSIRRSMGAVTGISVSAGNRISDRYDDAMFVFGEKRNGSRFSAIFPMSTKPGIASFRLSSYSSPTKGCPVIQCGQYNYRRGIHKGKEALRQNGPVVVRRDVDNDTIIEPTDYWDYPEYTGINIHAGGSSSRVGLNSSGCQVVYGGWFGQDWRQFHDIVYDIAAGQKDYHYTVISGLFFGSWYDSLNKDRYKWLWYGSRGDKVYNLQKRLKSMGLYNGNFDGVFGVETHKAVRRYQMGIKEFVDGIVDNATGNKLGIF